MFMRIAFSNAMRLMPSSTTNNKLRTEDLEISDLARVYTVATLSPRDKAAVINYIESPKRKCSI